MGRSWRVSGSSSVCFYVTKRRQQVPVLVCGSVAFRGSGATGCVIALQNLVARTAMWCKMASFRVALQRVCAGTTSEQSHRVPKRIEVQKMAVIQIWGWNTLLHEDVPCLASGCYPSMLSSTLSCGV
jgi:hypothetical protein